MMDRAGLALLGAAFVALSCGCALEPGRNHTEKTIRVCSPEGGCVDKTRDEIRAQRIGQPPTEGELEEEARIASLEEKAADDPKAAFDLALRFFRGDGVRRDSRKAVAWMKKAAEGGNTQAQVALGRLYLSGFEEMGPDLAAAESWLGVAAANGDEDAKKLLTEAQRAKRNEVAWRSWVGAYRSTWLGHWWHGYGYYLYWGDRGWHYY